MRELEAQYPHDYYGGKSPTNNDNEKKQHFLQQKENTKEAYSDGQVGFEAVFTDITRRGALPEKKPPFIQPKEIKGDS